jgi:hypothetical protein
MAILYVGGAISTITNVAATATCTYSPTSGHAVLVFVGLASLSTSTVTCVDSASNPLTAGPFFNPGTPTVASFYYTAPAGITSFTVNWTGGTTTASVSVVEYSGVVGISAPLTQNNVTNSTTPTISVTTLHNNDFIVAGISSSANTTTITTGTSRQQETTGTAKLVVADNTSATPASVTIAGTNAGGFSTEAAIELTTVISARDVQDYRETLVQSTADARDVQDYREALTNYVVKAHDVQQWRESLILSGGGSLKNLAFDTEFDAFPKDYFYNAAALEQSIQGSTVIWPVPSRGFFPVSFVVT